MRFFYNTFICCLLSCFVFAQDWSLDRSVQITANVQSAPAHITLNWLSEPATSFTLYRRVKGDSSWGSAVAILPYPTFNYDDDNVSIGISYEYRIVKNAPIKGQGVINAGINLPEVEQRGRLILVVDDTHADALATKINVLINDMEGDGWSVSRIDVSPKDEVTSVKNEIVELYNTDQNNFKAVLLLGNVPVPYAGYYYPDGHPDHEGAWPADLYYGEMDGNWTDVNVNVLVATDPRNHNIPSDGKFDQTVIPSNIDLQIGRVDFSNLPAFAESEEKLLKKYLDKNHAFRHKLFTAEPRGLLENNFAGLPEGFGQNAYRNFSAMFGSDEVYSSDFSTLFNESYLWSYGCGAGNYTSANGIITTEELAADSLQTVFTMLFGSYFGDWDTENNLLRAALATGTVLTNVWAGRPKYQFEHMAMGENIGYGTLLTQNTATNFEQDTSYGGRLIHNALMGDPTLRMHVVDPPGEELTLTENNANISINWEASTDVVLGYHIYRKVIGDSFFERINVTPITATTYVDSCRAYNETYVYMVRALKLETSASGTYYNLSQGVMGEATITTDLSVTPEFTFVIDNGIVTFTNTSTNGTSYLWNFGDEMNSVEAAPIHTYAENGTYPVTLTVFNDCFSETISMNVTVIVTGVSQIEYLQIDVSPLPADDLLHIKLRSDKSDSYQMQLISEDGKILLERKLMPELPLTVVTSHLSPGVYWLRIRNESGEIGLRKVVIM